MTTDKLILSVVLVMLLIVPAGCRQRSNAFVIALGDNIRTIDPIGSPSVDAASERIRTLIFNTLVKKDEKFDYSGELASDIKRSDDGMTYTFTLRDGVKFHDGRVLSSADVKYTEQEQVMAVGDGFWKTVTGRGNYNHYFSDPVTGQVGWMGAGPRQGGTSRLTDVLGVLAGQVPGGVLGPGRGGQAFVCSTTTVVWMPPRMLKSPTRPWWSDSSRNVAWRVEVAVELEPRSQSMVPPPSWVAQPCGGAPRVSKEEVIPALVINGFGPHGSPSPPLRGSRQKLAPLANAFLSLTPTRIRCSWVACRTSRST